MTRPAESDRRRSDNVATSRREQDRVIFAAAGDEHSAVAAGGWPLPAPSKRRDVTTL